MPSNRFTLLELIDLALRAPEVGAVNFNILHTVIANILLELGLDGLRPECQIADEALAQVAITKARLNQPAKKRPTKALTTQEIRGRLKAMEKQDPAEEVQTGSAKTDEILAAEEKVQMRDDESSGYEENLGTAEDEKKVQPETERDEKEGTISFDDRNEPEPDSGDEVGVEEEKKETVDTAEGSSPVEGEDGTRETVPGVKESKEKQAAESFEKEKEEPVQPFDEEKKKEIVKSFEKLIERSPSKETRIRAMSIEELQETARDLMEHTADVIADQAAMVTGALQILKDEELLDAEPARVMEEVWRATNINRRMEAAEDGLRELSGIIDVILDRVQDMEEQGDDVYKKTMAVILEIRSFLDRIRALEDMSKLHTMQIQECNDLRASEIQRLEDLINELTTDHDRTKSAVEDLQNKLDELTRQVVYKEDLEEAKAEMKDDLELRMKEMRKLLREVEDTLVKKENFVELLTRVEEMEETKVNREELGRLLEPGFIDAFLGEQERLKTELDELKITISHFEENFNALKTRIEEEILKMIESNFSSVNETLNIINAKLALLDPDEINDSFANLEDQTAMIIEELGEMKSSFDQLQKEEKMCLSKISNVNELLDRLEKTKADKNKMYELLEQKADLEQLLNKLDRTEFVAVVGDMKDEVERLGITVKINEEEMNENFQSVRHELSLKMYTEDFITATEPIRNRIKALMYELRRVREIALTHLFPDAPGVVKCISCKRGAHLAGPRYLGDANVELLQEVAARPSTRPTSSKSSKYQSGGSSQDTPNVKLPPVDLDSVPIPPADKPRERDPLRLPILFATARPNVGLAHERRKADIDRELAAYFASRPMRPCDGQHTRTLPQQRGIVFTPVMLPLHEKEEVLLDGIDQKIYKGAIYDCHVVDASSKDTASEAKERETDEPSKESTDENQVIQSRKETRKKKGFIKPDTKHRKKKVESRVDVTPAVVSLHVDDEPLLKTSASSKSRYASPPSHE